MPGELERCNTDVDFNDQYGDRYEYLDEHGDHTEKITFICWKGVTYVDVNFGVQYVDHCKYLDEDGDQEIVFSRWKCITDVESGDQYDDDCQYLDIKEKM